MRPLPPTLPIALVLAPIAVLTACGPAVAAPQAHEQQSQGPSDQATPEGRTGGARDTAAAAGDPAQAPAPARIHYDLADHVERAERFEGMARVMDLRSSSGAKYTSGGWLSAMRAGVEIEGESSGVVMGSRGRLLIPFDGEGDAELVMEVRPMRPGVLRLYVGETEVADAPLSAEAFSTVRARIPAAALRRGENTLLLRTPNAIDVDGVGRVGLLVRWLRLGPAGARPSETAPSPLFTRLGSHPALTLADGERVGYGLEVPPRARLRGVVVGEGRLRVTVHRDGAPPTSLRATAAGPFDLDLARFAGELCRIDLSSDGAPLQIGRPTVVTTDPEPPRELPRRPTNVLLYVIDTLRADKLSPYDADTRVRTPGLDRFVASATTFERGHTQENWTKPSVATLLSALMPWQHTAVTGEAMVPQSVRLLPEILKDRGFYTGSFIANGYVSQAFGFRQGWDTYRNYIRENRRTAAEHVAADVLSWLDERPDEQPFLLYVHTIDPHVPYRPPNEYLRMYEPSRYTGPLSFRRDATLLEGVKTGRIPTNARDRAHLEALYDGEITYHDVHFAAILEGLARRGLDENTMVVVTADHGEEFWDHGSVGHGHSVYEELLHIPLIVRLPGIDAPLRVSDPVGLVDVVPTILDALGGEMPDDLSGRSMLPQLLGRDDTAPRVAIAGFMENWRAIIIGRTKLIQRTNRQTMLFDLEADPGEQNDVASDRPLAVRHARGLLGLALAASSPGSHSAARRGRAPSTHQPADAQIDAELEAQLEALGYVQ